jgi:CDP-diacylglycerol--serine O-phosphatidyltransferase
MMPVRPLRERRAVFLLPSLFTMANMFCGYACIVHAMRGDYESAAPFVGLAVVLDVLDGRIARMTGSTSAFGVEFDSLADVISFGVAPAVLAFSWGLTTFGRLGWAAGFIYVAAAAIRLARFNIQGMSATDKRYFAGLPSPAAASVPASTVFAYPYGLTGWYATLALPMVLVPAFLMVSTIRYLSFKTNELKKPQSYRRLILIALVIFAITTHPQITLVVLAYSYLVSPLVGAVAGRIRRRQAGRPARPATPPAESAQLSPDEPGPPPDAYRDL